MHKFKYCAMSSKLKIVTCIDTSSETIVVDGELVFRFSTSRHPTINIPCQEDNGTVLQHYTR